jgi:hypothetical protein
MQRVGEETTVDLSLRRPPNKHTTIHNGITPV